MGYRSTRTHKVLMMRACGIDYHNSQAIKKMKRLVLL